MSISGKETIVCPTSGDPCELADLCVDRALSISNNINPDNPFGSLGILPDAVSRLVEDPVACIKEHMERLEGLAVTVSADEVASAEVVDLRSSAAWLVDNYMTEVSPTH